MRFWRKLFGTKPEDMDLPSLLNEIIKILEGFDTVLNRYKSQGNPKEIESAIRNIDSLEKAVKTLFAKLSSATPAKTQKAEVRTLVTSLNLIADTETENNALNELGLPGDITDALEIEQAELKHLLTALLSRFGN